MLVDEVGFAKSSAILVSSSSSAFPVLHLRLKRGLEVTVKARSCFRGTLFKETRVFALPGLLILVVELTDAKIELALDTTESLTLLLLQRLWRLWTPVSESTACVALGEGFCSPSDEELDGHRNRVKSRRCCLAFSFNALLALDIETAFPR